MFIKKKLNLESYDWMARQWNESQNKGTAKVQY